MGTPLNFRNPRARELAAMRRVGITDAVISALENELRRERETVPLAERLERIARASRMKAGPDGRDVTEAERDDMWTRV